MFRNSIKAERIAAGFKTQSESLAGIRAEERLRGSLTA